MLIGKTISAAVKRTGEKTANEDTPYIASNPFMRLEFCRFSEFSHPLLAELAEESPVETTTTQSRLESSGGFACLKACAPFSRLVPFSQGESPLVL